MELTFNDVILGLIGGVLIGIACSIMWVMLGRITGISGIFSQMFSFSMKGNSWRFFFILGLVLGGFVFVQLIPLPTDLMTLSGDNVWFAIIGGLLVGFGSVFGSGCTSGHGICGLSRLSKRSFLAIFLFMFFGMATVTLLHIIN